MIPPELRNDSLPMSMRFYDPIFRILESFVEDETKYSFTTQRNINLVQIQENDLINKLIEKIKGKDEKIFHKLKRDHAMLLPKDIDLNQIASSRHLQTGKSIVIEYTKERLLRST